MTTFDPDLGTHDRGRGGEGSPDDACTPGSGIGAGAVEQISWSRGEPRWMTRLRMRSARLLDHRRMAEWFAVNLPDIDLGDLTDVVRPETDQSGRPGPVNDETRGELEARGILFCDMDIALREYPHLLERYLGTVVPPGDDELTALNTSIWSGGTFIYVPPGVEVEMPLQADVDSSSANAGRFERTLVIADEGSEVHYIEGCSAPLYTADPLRSAVVEIVVEPRARVTYTAIQNWSPNVYNLVTKRARVGARGHVEWTDGNIGSKLTLKCPTVDLVGDGATGEVRSVTYAGDGQHQYAGARVVHTAPNTTSTIVSRSIIEHGGITTHHALVRVDEGVVGATSHVECDALLLDEDSVSKMLPRPEVDERDGQISRDATVSKIADEQLFHLMSRGLSEAQAIGLIVNGFIEPITRSLPMEYAVEWSRLIELQMDGSVG